MVSDVDGSNLTLLTVPNKVNLSTSPKWTGDQKSIFYSKQEGSNIYYTIYRYDIIKKKEYKILEDVGGPTISVSPDGRFLAYDYPDDNSDIYVKDLKTGENVNLTNGKGINLSPAFSPDGKKIAFISTRDKPNEVYIMDIKGKKCQENY